MKYFLKGLAVFGVMLVIAFIFNETLVFATDQTINCFFISRHFPCTLQLLSMIYPKVPYVVFLLIYIIGFILIALIIFAIAKLIYWLATLKGRKKGEENN